MQRAARPHRTDPAGGVVDGREDRAGHAARNVLDEPLRPARIGMDKARCACTRGSSPLAAPPTWTSSPPGCATLVVPERAEVDRKLVDRKLRVRLELAVGRRLAGLQVDDDATALLVPLESVDPAVEPARPTCTWNGATRRPPARARWPAARRRVGAPSRAPSPAACPHATVRRSPAGADPRRAGGATPPRREVMRRGERARGCRGSAGRSPVPPTCSRNQRSWQRSKDSTLDGETGRAAPRHAPAGRRTGAPARTTTTGRRPEPRPGRDRRGVRRRPPGVAHRSPGRRRRCVARPPGGKGERLGTSVSGDAAVMVVDAGDRPLGLEVVEKPRRLLPSRSLDRGDQQPAPGPGRRRRRAAAPRPAVGAAAGCTEVLAIEAAQDLDQTFATQE